MTNDNNNILAKENVSFCYLFLSFQQRILNLALKTRPLGRYRALGVSQISFIVIALIRIIFMIYLF